MIKFVALFRKKDGLSTEASRAYYENERAKLFARVLEMPGVERYVRRYLTPLKDAIWGNAPSSAFIRRRPPSAFSAMDVVQAPQDSRISSPKVKSAYLR